MREERVGEDGEAVWPGQGGEEVEEAVRARGSGLALRGRLLANYILY